LLWISSNIAAHYSFGVDIEQFYDADERRRQSAEVELGTEWRDAQGVRYELNWIEDTGELYVMMEPPPPEWEGPFGDIHVQTGDRAHVDAMTVSVIAQVESHERLEQVLDGWQAAMEGEDSVNWLADRLKAEGVADPSWVGESS
jgi:hypothetical protein